MDNETARHLWALRKVNGVLIQGLRTAISVREKEEELTRERRKSMIESVKGLVAQSEVIYGEEDISH
jgi:hypothetical protein